MHLLGNLSVSDDVWAFADRRDFVSDPLACDGRLNLVADSFLNLDFCYRGEVTLSFLKSLNQDAKGNR